jgi:small subunit ribosomal protein S17
VSTEDNVADEITDDTQSVTADEAAGEAGDDTQSVTADDAAGEGAGAPAVPKREVASERRDPATATRPRRKVREGVVVSNGMDKTAVVAVIERVRHPKYNKFVLQTKRLYAHDEANDVNVGDKVRLMETRPLSKTKRWRVVEVMERAR